MTDFLQTPRYQLPQEWVVPETMCVKIRIPQDPQYFGMLIGLLDTLKWSKNFAHDETKTGAATVSRTWQQALESEPIEIEGCEVPETRINPETCLFEVNCGTEEDPNWQPIPTHAYDPREDPTWPIPYPDPPPEGQTNQCLAAANVGEWVWHAGDIWASQLDSGTYAEFIVLVMSIISALFQLETNIVIDETNTLFIDIDPETILADWGALDKQEFIDIIVCYIEENGTLPAENWGDFLSVLLGKTGENQAWYLVHYVCILMGWAGVNITARIGGVTEAECDECEWTHTFDFSLGAQGWVSFEDDHSHVASQLTGGVWTYFQTVHDPFGNQYRCVHIVREVSPTTSITSVSFEGDVDRGTYIVAWNDNIFVNGTSVQEFDNTEEGAIFREWIGSAAADEISVLLTISHVGSGGTPDGTGEISRVVVTGIGDNPFD